MLCLPAENPARHSFSPAVMPAAYEPSELDFKLVQPSHTSTDSGEARLAALGYKQEVIRPPASCCQTHNLGTWTRWCSALDMPVSHIVYMMHCSLAEAFHSGQTVQSASGECLSVLRVMAVKPIHMFRSPCSRDRLPCKMMSVPACNCQNLHPLLARWLQTWCCMWQTSGSCPCSIISVLTGITGSYGIAYNNGGASPGCRPGI